MEPPELDLAVAKAHPRPPRPHEEELVLLVATQLGLDPLRLDLERDEARGVVSEVRALGVRDVAGLARSSAPSRGAMASRPPPTTRIDVGSNASRLLIVEADDPTSVSEVESFRHPVRMGHGVFLTGRSIPVPSTPASTPRRRDGR